MHDPRNATCDLAGNKRRTASLRFVIKKNSITSVNSIRFPIIDNSPISKELRNSVGAPRIKWSILIQRFPVFTSEKLRRTRLIKPAAFREPSADHRVKQAKGADGVDLSGVLGRVERNLNVGLRREIVDFVWPDFGEDGDERG